MAEQQAAKTTLYCSFCGKADHEVKILITSPSSNICGECVALCVRVMATTWEGDSVF